jgi:hypothetical protein
VFGEKEFKLVVSPIHPTLGDIKVVSSAIGPRGDEEERGSAAGHGRAIPSMATDDICGRYLPCTVEGRTEEKEMGDGPTGAKSYFPYVGPTCQSHETIKF